MNIVLGNIETKSESAEVISRNVAIRNELDLYVNVLHCKSYPGVSARQKDIDIVIIRQNTEGEYAMLEHEVMCTFVVHKKMCIFLECRRYDRKSESCYERELRQSSSIRF